jgi:LysM repeat protein
MKKQFSTLTRGWIGLALLLVMLFAAPTGYGLAQDTVTTIDPSSSEVAVGATTTVDIRVENVTGLYGAEVHLTFDPAVVEVVDANAGEDGVQIQPGTLLSPDFTAENAVDHVNGRIDFAIAQMAPHEPVSGSGVLATITLRGKAAGTSALSFSTTLPTLPVILSDRDGEPISTGTQDGSVVVTGGQAPTPTETPVPTETPTPTQTSTPGPTPTPTLTPTSGPSPTPTLTPTPGPTPTVTPVPPAGAVLGYHTVQPGETLFCIGRAYGVDPYAIAARSGILNPSVIRPGQVLTIPNVPRSLPPGRVCPRQFGDGTPPPGCRWHHTVARGENLYRISLRYGVNMWTIAEANHILNLHYIRAGQELCIP